MTVSAGTPVVGFGLWLWLDELCVTDDAPDLRLYKVYDGVAQISTELST